MTCRTLCKRSYICLQFPSFGWHPFAMLRQCSCKLECWRQGWLAMNLITGFQVFQLPAFLCSDACFLLCALFAKWILTNLSTGQSGVGASQRRVTMILQHKCGGHCATSALRARVYESAVCWSRLHCSNCHSNWSQHLCDEKGEKDEKGFSHAST